MRPRPAACLSLLIFLILVFLPAEVLYEPQQVEEACEVRAAGRVGWLVHKEGRTQIYLQNCQVFTRKCSFEEEKLLVYLAEPAEYTVGTDLSLSGTIYPIEQSTNPGQFDSRLYYAGKGINYSVYADCIRVLDVHPAPIREGLLYIRERIGQVYDRVLDSADSGLLKAMVLGEKESLDAETKELYQKSGISHLLAVSGLHISLLGLGVYRFLRRQTGSFAVAGIPAILFLCAYGWMTGASVSAVRAVVMCILMIVADLIGRTYDMLTAMGAAAALLFLTNPLSARQSAFLLSFGAVLGIALIQPLWTLYKEKQGRILQAFSAGLSVLFITFPLLLCFFCEYSLYSVILNLLVIPLMSVLMICGILCGLAGLVWLPAAQLPGVLCHLILWLYEQAGTWCMNLPGAVLHIGQPGLWKIILYYAVLAVSLMLLYRERRRRKYWHKNTPFVPDRRCLVLCLSMMLLVSCLLCLRVHRGAAVTMLDVGQGDAIFLQSPSGTTFLYDGGSTSEKNVGTYRILPFLQSEGIAGLDYIFVSHADQDHISGLEELIEESIKPGGIHIGHAVLPNLDEKDSAYQSLERLFQEAGIPVLYMKQGGRLSEKTFSLTCLWPGQSKIPADRNDLSLVLLMEYGEFQMLFTGDIGQETEECLIASGALKDVEILKVAHHGSKYSSSDAFLQIVMPEVSLISCSEDNLYGHPGAETLARLRAAGSRVYVTKDCGAVRVWTDGETVKVRGYVE